MTEKDYEEFIELANKRKLTRLKGDFADGYNQALSDLKKLVKAELVRESDEYRECMRFLRVLNYESFEEVIDKERFEGFCSWYIEDLKSIWYGEVSPISIIEKYDLKPSKLHDDLICFARFGNK